MNELKHEQLSALIDDEVTHETLSTINTLLEDNAAKEIWTRYLLIGDSLRGYLPEYLKDISGSVSQAIASEPTVLAPKKSSDLMKPIMGFAIAASVAAIAIFNVQQARQIPETGQAVFSQSSIATNTSSMANSQLVTQQKGQARIYQTQSVDPRLSRYMVNHNEYRANTGVSGMPPHVRMVANNSELSK